jgi:hypothetical protein
MVEQQVVELVALQAVVEQVLLVQTLHQVLTVVLEVQDQVHQSLELRHQVLMSQAHFHLAAAVAVVPMVLELLERLVLLEVQQDQRLELEIMQQQILVVVEVERMAQHQAVLIMLVAMAAAES